MPILTFVTPKPEKDFDLWIKKSYPDITIEDRIVLDDRAVRWRMKTPLSKTIIDQIRQEFRIDIFQTNDQPIKLFMADMDSTIVSGETLDDIAMLAGIGDKVENITARAMRGEMDFEEALLTRVDLLKGMSVDIIDQTLSKTCLNDGAEKLLNHLKSVGIHCVLISGGFTQFTSHFAQKLGFDDHFGNNLIIENNVLTGDVKRPILDKDFKKIKLEELSQLMNIDPENIMAIGDGANDLPMLQSAGVGVGYYPKPLLQNKLINRIEYTNLESLKYLTA